MNRRSTDWRCSSKLSTLQVFRELRSSSCLFPQASNPALTPLGRSSHEGPIRLICLSFPSFPVTSPICNSYCFILSLCCSAPFVWTCRTTNRRQDHLRPPTSPTLPRERIASAADLCVGFCRPIFSLDLSSVAVSPPEYHHRSLVTSQFHRSFL